MAASEDINKIDLTPWQLAPASFQALVVRVPCESMELPGFTVRLEKLCYHRLPSDKPHAFVYYLIFHNASEHTVTLLGRKWVIQHSDGTSLVVEGEKIVGNTPRIPPGEQWSYDSYHVTGCDARAQGCFHGVDELGRKLFVRLAPFDLKVPRQTGADRIPAP